VDEKFNKALTSTMYLIYCFSHEISFSLYLIALADGRCENSALRPFRLTSVITACLYSKQNAQLQCGIYHDVLCKTKMYSININKC